MAQQNEEDFKADERTKLLDTDSYNYTVPTDVPKLRIDNVSLMNYPSHSLTNLFKSARSLKAMPMIKSSIHKKLTFNIEYKSIMLYTRLIIIYFIFLFFISILEIILYFIPLLLNTMNILILFIILLILSCFGGLYGMRMIYDWYYIEEQIFSDLKKETEGMETEKERLNKKKDDLKYNVKSLQLKISNLGFSAAELEEELKEYDELKNALQQRINENNSLQNILNEFVGIIDGMQFLQTENAKAMVLANYYSSAFKDDTYGLTKKQYNKFMAKLDSETRTIFKKFGGFEKYDNNNNGIIEINEFMFMLEDVIQELQEKELKTMRSRYQSPSIKTSPLAKSANI